MEDAIKLAQVCENNLKNINVEVPHRKHTVITGVSGSGKSTLAYEVIYATAQRKLLDCMSEKEKRFGIKMKKPKIGSIEGLSPVISLKQVKPNNNPRSTIGTFTSIGSYVRSLLAMHGQCRCLCCERVFKQSSVPALVKDMEMLQPGTVVEVSFPYFFSNIISRELQIDGLRQKGYRHIYVGQERFNLRDAVAIDEEIEFILVVESKFQASATLKKSDMNCIKNASKQGDNYIAIRLLGENSEAMQRFYDKHGCPEHHLIATTMDASGFSYNDMSCACQECKGKGVTKIVHPSKVIKNPKKTLRQGPFFQEVYSMSHPYHYMSLYSLAEHYGFSFDEPYESLSDEAKQVIMYGSKEESFILKRPEDYEKILPNYLAKEGEFITFKGILTRIGELYQEMLEAPTTPSPDQENFFKMYMYEMECPSCNGTRLKKIKNYTVLNGKSYAQMGKMEFSELLEFFEQMQGNEVSQPIIDALKERLTLMEEIGLEYLSFERRIDSLSGGEYQRLRMANQVGSGLVGLTYIIDEPTDGLHGTDNQKVINVINRLLQKGNTVITIEHNFDVIAAADYIIEMGPGAGIEGGEVIATGTPEELQKNPDSIIGKCLLERPSYRFEKKVFDSEGSIRITGIEANNVKNADVEIPLNRMTCFTGVSGSGKSTVVHEVLYKAACSRMHHSRVIPGKYKRMEGLEQIKEIVCINQELLNGKNSSIPATYLEIFDIIRMFFSQSVADDHEMRDKKAYFSFNSKGACPVCKGKGYIENYIQYFGETRITCEECNGQQYIEEVLEVKYKGKSIKEVLDMTFAEALDFFEEHKNVYEKVKLACDLGLGYMQLGQPLSTLSGGEAQRMKLIKEMTKYKNKKKLLYIFDEPTVGLHAKDVSRFIKVIQRIVAEQNTVVLVEHNPDMILSSDYIIEMGPGAGKYGGEVVFAGIPSQMLEHATSKTATYLRGYVGDEN